MHIELIDALRCPVPHEDSWLVGRFDSMQDRHVITGALGCPVCRAEYPIERGVVYFDSSAGASEFREAGHASEPEGSPPGQTGSEAVIRLGALLGLADPGGVVLLAGAWATFADRLGELAHVRLLLLNPDRSVGAGDSAVVCREQIPVARGSLRAMALDARNSTPALLGSAAEVLRGGSRLVAPASGLLLPEGLQEIARDQVNLVAECRRGSAVVPLRRR